MPLDDEMCHRIGGGNASNLELRPHEMSLTPPGISVLIGGTPQKAADDWRDVFPKPGASSKAATIGTAEIGKIRGLGFDVLAMPTPNFPNHGRLIHTTRGAAGFDKTGLSQLEQVFSNTTGL